jgi:hypothetical protein
LALGHKLHYLLACLGLEGLRRAVWKGLTANQRERFMTAEAAYRRRSKSEVDVFKSVMQRELEPETNALLTDLLETYVGAESELARHFYLSAEQVRAMRDGGMYFGGHSRTHPWFDFISAARRETEIRASCEWLATIQDAPFAFAYPYGGLAEDAPVLLAQNEFCAAFITREGTTQHDPFSIGRFDGEEWNHKSALQ